MRFRKFFQDDGARAFLVAAVGVGKQVADGDRRHAVFAERAGRRPHRVLVERLDLVAFPADPAGNFPRHALRRDRFRLLIEIIERIAVARLGLDLLHGAVALGDHQPDPRAAHLQQRVGRDRRAVAEEFDGAGRRSPGDVIVHPVQHAESRVGRGGRDLFDGDLAGIDIEQNEVRVGAADIDAEAVTRIRSHSCSRQLNIQGKAEFYPNAGNPSPPARHAMDRMFPATEFQPILLL